ncbi:Dynein light chain 4, axonemal [Intoshia linei]|uniref:Dynein light chain n=1 Tax=Intoshia linei TaxID=1819745 RepID=A0A177AZV0_9BILA|nr:Dynein light chain 4, axonemal [Intoshia linei]
MTDVVDKGKESFKKIVHTYPLIMSSDMNEEMQSEAMELCVTASEKFLNNNENAAKMIKEVMDKKFGPSWQVVVGEGYGYEIMACKHMYMFFGGCSAILLFKIS